MLIKVYEDNKHEGFKLGDIVLFQYSPATPYLVIKDGTYKLLNAASYETVYRRAESLKDLFINVRSDIYKIYSKDEYLLELKKNKINVTLRDVIKLTSFFYVIL